MTRARLAIIIPTVAERSAWLAECLDSLLTGDSSARVEVIVSGNGTGADTEAVCRARGVRMLHHPVRLKAAEHGRLLTGLDLGDWIWPIADDDLAAPGALDAALSLIDSHEPALIVGRTRRFLHDDLSDLSVPVPAERPFVIASGLRSAADATHLRIDLGAFIYKSGLITIDMYDHYAGTSHEGFGALWSGLASQHDPTVLVTPQVFVHARQAAKAHDENAWRTWLGMLRLGDLLPPEVQDVAMKEAPTYLSFRPVLRAIAEGERPHSTDIPRSIWDNAPVSKRVSFTIATRTPKPLALAALKARERFGFLSRARGAKVDR
jgi:hypothetical protein